MSYRTEVVLCTYNGSAFVVEQLQSILAQTRPVDRITVRDDRSQDATVAAIQRFIESLPAEQAARIDLQVNATNLGYAANFAGGIAQARGDILLLSDQDDAWEPDKVALLLQAFERGTADMVVSDGSLMDARGVPLGQRSVLQSHGLPAAVLEGLTGDGFAQLARHNVVNGAALAVRRVAAQAALPLPGEVPHDYWLALWCAAHGGIAFLPQRLYRYRQHGANAIGIGTRGVWHNLVGIWRHPRAPRQRERRIWAEVTERLATLPPPDSALEVARRKLAWLDAVVAHERSAPGRSWRILRSALRGDYRRYGPPQALARDLVSLIR